MYFCVRYAVPYRDLEEILAERGIGVDHATLNRWVIKYSAPLALKAKKRKRSAATSWCIDEAYIKVKREWVYLYRAIDKFDDTIDFMLSEHRKDAAATTFFKQAIDANGFPVKVVMDKSGANYYAGLENMNCLLMLAGLISCIEICQVKYLNNRIEQDHCFIKKITNPMKGFKAFYSAKATLDGIETAHRISKGQLTEESMPAYQQFMALAG